jgi:hypothetical protein
MSRTWSLSLTRRIGNEEAPRRSRHGETRKNRKIVEGENHLTRIKNVFQDSGERAYNAAIPFRGSGKCTWLLSIKMVLAPEKGRKGPRRPRARLPAHSALRWTRSGGRADGLLSADSVAKVPNCPALGRVLISGADRRFGCPKLHPQRRLTLLALGVEGGRVQWRAGAHSRPPVTPEWWGRDPSPGARSLLYHRPACRSCLCRQSSAAISSKLHTLTLGSRKSRLRASRDHPGLETRHTLVLGSLASGLPCLSEPTLWARISTSRSCQLRSHALK